MSIRSVLTSRTAAACLLLAGVALLAWQGRQLQQQVRWPALQPPDITAPAPVAPPALSRLLPAPSATSTAIAPEALGPMQLQASLVADDPQYSRALLQLPGQGTLNLQQGEQVLPGVVLEHILPDHVVLRAGDAEQVLWLRQPAPADAL